MSIRKKLSELNRRRKEKRRAATSPTVAPQMVTSSRVADCREVGMRDANICGWFNQETGELFTGFPIVEGDIFVDVGCGDGGMSMFSARNGAKVTLVDVNATSLQASLERVNSEKRHPAQALLSDGDRLPLPNEFADKVISTEVLEHVDCPKSFLSELVRIGKPGALYLLAVPDPVAEEIQKHVAPAASFEKPNHIRIIGREEFGQMVTDAGLTILKRDSYGAFWGIFNTFLWSCHTSFDKPEHPILHHWTQAWHEVLNLPDAQKIQRLLNDVIPKSQVIIAMKPR